MTGLGRSEPYRLQWGQIDFTKHTLTIQRATDGTVKGAGSTREVDLPADLTALLGAWKQAANSLSVIECDNQAKPGATHRACRCGRIFGKAAAWLRAGVQVPQEPASGTDALHCSEAVDSAPPGRDSNKSTSRGARQLEYRPSWRNRWGMGV